MGSTAPSSSEPLLAAARGGNEKAYRELVEPHRRELHAHCYRMLGSVHDAEDALQDAMLRAWKGLRRFEGRASVRSWLYTIATNACLDLSERRAKRVLPMELGPATEAATGPGQPMVESVWIEPYPDERLGVEPGLTAPEARFERRESLELAFVAALQHLEARPRAVLILREVLGYSAREVAEAMDTTVAAVNSALQRARKTLDERLPDRTQQQTLRTLGDRKVQILVEDYMEAMEACDVPRVVAMLTDDAAWAMPPLASWFGGPAGGRPAVEDFLRRWPLSGSLRWRHVACRASGQPAIGCYTWHAAEGAFLPFCIDVLTLEGGRIREVCAFVARPGAAPPPEHRGFGDWPDHALDERRVVDLFDGFGLPRRLPA